MKEQRSRYTADRKLEQSRREASIKAGLQPRASPAMVLLSVPTCVSYLSAAALVHCFFSSC